MRLIESELWDVTTVKVGTVSRTPSSWWWNGERERVSRWVGTSAYGCGSLCCVSYWAPMHSSNGCLVSSENMSSYTYLLKLLL